MTEKKTIHFILSPEDSDLISWKNSLPKRAFNRMVSEILVSESLGKTATVPCEFSSAECSEPVHCQLRLQDENALRLLGTVEPGEYTPFIKKIVRKHIRKNREKPKMVDATLLLKLLTDLLTKISDDSKDRHLLCEFCKFVYKDFYIPLMASYKTNGEKKGDSDLRRLVDENRLDTKLESVWLILHQKSTAEWEALMDDGPFARFSWVKRPM